MKNIFFAVIILFGTLGVATNGVARSHESGTVERWMTQSSILNAVVQLNNHVKMFENNLAIRRLLDYKPTKKVALRTAFAPFTETNSEELVNSFLDVCNKDIQQFLNGAAKITKKNGNIIITPESATLLRIVPLALKESAATLFSTIKKAATRGSSALTVKKIQKIRVDLSGLRNELKKRVAADHRYVQ